MKNPDFTVREIIKDFISLIYPSYCLACSQSLVKGEEIICSGCLLDMPKTNFHKHDENPLLERLSLRMPLQHAFAYYHFKKGSKVQELLHSFKYHHHPEIGVKLGKVMGLELVKEGFEHVFDIIVPVPLHESRKRVRGYNQSEEFAKGLSETLQIPYTENFIKRSVKTQTQTRKTKLLRWQNVSNVFEMKQAEEIRGKRVLLVDDVVTTGATLEACANPLIEAGCIELSVACIAVA
jgi:ComF family protein